MVETKASKNYEIKEVWRPLPKHEGEYEVSSLGRVRSIFVRKASEHFSNIIKLYQDGKSQYEISKLYSLSQSYVCNIINGKFRLDYGVLLNPYKNKKGYLTVTINRCTRDVHDLVLTAFVGPRPDGMQASHINGNKEDNSVDNLKWETSKENIGRKVLHGTQRRGEEVYNAILTSEQVFEIRRLYKCGETYLAIAKRFGVSVSTVCAIVKRINWAWL